MARFKVGDRARTVNSINHPEYIGRECTIVGVNILDLSGKIRDYAIEVDGLPNHPITGYWVTNEEYLEPIIELGSWDELQKTINWNPTKEITHVG